MTAARLAEAIHSHVDAGEVPGAIVGVLRDGEVSLQALGLPVDALFRISSNTKPMAAALALLLAEEGVLGLADPVERFVPELAGRRVLRRIDGPLDETVPAERPVTVDDLLTMRLGFGFVFESASPAVDAAAEAARSTRCCASGSCTRSGWTTPRSSPRPAGCPPASPLTSPGRRRSTTPPAAAGSTHRRSPTPAAGWSRPRATSCGSPPRCSTAAAA